MTIENKIKSWKKLSEKLAAIRIEEMALRKEIAESILGSITKGSKTITCGKYKMTATAKLNTKIEREELQAIWKDLTDNERQAFKFDPKIVAKEYKKLPQNSSVHKVITNTPGAPGLSIKGII